MKVVHGMRWLSSVALAAVLASGAAMAQKTQLTVYTALETDQLKAYQEGFNKVHPDIELTWVRDSTGIITAKILAEKAAPKADVIMGVAATSLAIHAGINAADAVCGARIGKRAAGEDHDHVLTLLRQAGPDGAEVERELRRLLPLKTKAEYGPDDIARSTAAKAVERAERCAAVAKRVAAATR